MPVRVQVPLRVLKKSECESESEHTRLFFLKTHSHTSNLLVFLEFFLNWSCIAADLLLIVPN